MEAAWGNAGSKAAPVTTCFEHVRADDKILQRRAGTSDWYTLLSNPADQADEAANLARGDLVSAAIESISGAQKQSVQ